MPLKAAIKAQIKAISERGDERALCRIFQKMRLSYDRIHDIIAHYFGGYSAQHSSFRKRLYYLYPHILSLHTLNDTYLKTEGCILYWNLYIYGVDRRICYELFDLI